eukprot:5063064-Heterocapsa_arctica.AAC.1
MESPIGTAFLAGSRDGGLIDLSAWSLSEPSRWSASWLAWFFLESLLLSFARTGMVGFLGGGCASCTPARSPIVAGWDTDRIRRTASSTIPCAL